MSLRVYNTLSRRVEEFVPMEDRRVRMYVCGPTVYNHLHIGNFRGPIFFNLVCRWLEHLGYQVTYVFNYTDVDDKIIKRAGEEGVESSEISQRYITSFEQDFERLQLRVHDHRPQVTDFITPIVEFIRQLVERKVAYEVDGQVFYSIQRFARYGGLSGKKLADLIAGQRVEIDEQKEHPGDFVLWKPARPGAPAWDSPWGRGRPGWHIECSTMIQELLGETIDIHGGAIDLIFPHHENEIAQGEGRTSKPYCKYWMHHDFIGMNDEKMSKSVGNIILAKDFMDRYHPEILKYLFLSIHYRSLLGVGVEKVMDAMAALSRIYHSLALAVRVVAEGDSEGVSCPALMGLMSELDDKIARALNDDFNTGEVMAALFEVVRAFNALGVDKQKAKGSYDVVTTAQAYLSWIRKWGELMSLFNEPPAALLGHFQEILIKERGVNVQQVQDLVTRRKRARLDRNWSGADAIREQLTAMGIELMDGVEGREWNVGFN